MIKYIQLTNAGPAPGINLNFAPRLNLLTGDNGLGKTFVLDTAWWTITQTWAEQPILPGRETENIPLIGFEISDPSGKLRKFSSTFDFQSQTWSEPKDLFFPETLVIYARVNGGISVFDPLRNRTSKRQDVSDQDEDMDSSPRSSLHKRADAYHFKRNEIWNGLSMGDRVLCNGLIRDWVTWQYQKENIFKSFKEILKLLSPGKGETII
ncbi:Uncharacterized protein dnl_27920 [Desulfonema limicola]|uniref:Rad50/SbcC-type AAA domain-containing protein n=1 Tax=Desulfonema limicola TaxID=45656 RepID=A0A975GGR6_9BACT|nr:hypothetical protein [Desulfonema limicola]QTA80487.1 Uncharacterized protein dnl_27920 [Desulfonema limicola]